MTLLIKQYSHRSMAVIISAVIGLFCAALLAGCEDNTFEKAGETTDKVIDDTADGIDDIADDVEDKFDDATDN